MMCSKCQFDNPAGSRFCLECGDKLELHCPRCGSELPPAAKFCNHCGHKLDLPAPQPTPKEPKDLSFEEKLDKIQRYLPGGLTEKILSQRGKIEGERRQVTVMFCDMEGFTPLSESLGPEAVYSLMDQVYEILIHKVHDYEGTVNEMTGDGIMALFGAPMALEDAPQRAIRSALAIHKEMAKFSPSPKPLPPGEGSSFGSPRTSSSPSMREDRGGGDEITTRSEREKGLPSIRMRIGIHTGPVVVGTLGNDLRVEFKAVGDTVNMASRMEGLAEPGTTLVTEETFKLTEGFFRFESLGEKRVKGKEEPVKVYQVIAPSTRRTRFDVSAEQGLTPFVGRELELELLLDGLERAKGGRGQAVSIVADAGMGKSRLLYEFRKAVANDDVTILEGKCLSYRRGVAYHPVVDILKGNFDIRDDDRDSEIGEKVRRGLKAIQADDAATLPYLLELLSVKESGIDDNLRPETRKDRTIKAFSRIILKGAGLRPQIIVVEDLHWMDKNSEEAFKDLMEHIGAARVLLLLTYRPEYVHTWGGRSYHSQVSINRLSTRETMAMLVHILGAGEIPEAIETLVLEKTEGVPFFVEEFVKSLRDLKIIQRKDQSYVFIKPQDVSIPSTIQDVLMARADALPEGARELLQSASAIEREFSHALIQKVAGLPEQELLSRLSTLKDAEMLYERGVYPESTYIFKHALTREVAYGSILATRKKHLHTAIGQALEKLHPETLHEHYKVLCEHFLAGEDYGKAAGYAGLAGRKAEKEGLFVEAVPYMEKAIACLEKLPPSKEVIRKIIDVRTTTALYIVQMGDWARPEALIEPIIEITYQINDKKRIAQHNLILGMYEDVVRGNNQKAIEYLTKALDLATKINHRASIQLANYFLSAALGRNCSFEKCQEHLKRALDINIEAKSLWGIAAVKSTQALIYNEWGRIDRAYQIGREALQLAEDSQDIYSESFACTYHGMSCYRKGLLEEAIGYLMRGLEASQRINGFFQIFGAMSCLGECYLTQGDYKKSLEFCDLAISLGEKLQYNPGMLNCVKTAAMISRVSLGEKSIDLRSLYDYESQNRAKFYEGPIRRNIGWILLLLNSRHMNEAEDWIKKAIAADQENGMMWDLAMDHSLYADWFKARGDLPHTRAQLQKAAELFQKCGADGWVKRTEEQLAQL